MTDYQKKRITLMRKQHIGYATIASKLKLSLGSVKQFCRRNGLQSADLVHDTQPENISVLPPAVSLINAENRGNSSTANRPGASVAAQSCEITISYADKDDKTAVADVLSMLIHADYEEVPTNEKGNMPLSCFHPGAGGSR